MGLDWILTDFGRVRRFLGCLPGPGRSPSRLEWVGGESMWRAVVEGTLFVEVLVEIQGGTLPMSGYILLLCRSWIVFWGLPLRVSCLTKVKHTRRGGKDWWSSSDASIKSFGGDDDPSCPYFILHQGLNEKGGERPVSSNVKQLFLLCGDGNMLLSIHWKGACV